jgi:hypothetical protein
MSRLDTSGKNAAPGATASLEDGPEVVVDAHVLPGRLQVAGEVGRVDGEVEDVAHAAVRPHPQALALRYGQVAEEVARVALQVHRHVRVVVEASVALAVVVAPGRELPGARDAVDAEVVVRLGLAHAAVVVDEVALGAVRVAVPVVVVAVRIGVRLRVVAGFVRARHGVAAVIAVGLVHVADDRLVQVAFAVSIDVHRVGHLERHGGWGARRRGTPRGSPSSPSQ